ncbi:ATP-dependent DNA helicase [Actinotalea sp. M2MS4P-6]|uniref:ATP-dependent DNA helicase n=1 Tax=Actinotalea sp. M2MS4P-6 TaxID=2983762 RepID=UPI0021E45699|nr:ATP-dependent DNA helicase [Actinotalea sp. M2MS4P-6]MCV2393451.1 ATP-dependent DNA helicase [Actinotalea sp. M2MS4P-6]
MLDDAVRALGGARREGQHAMAHAVAATIDRGEHLLVQAGTGTGKSLAYLVPAVRHAVRENERVVISTATLALQRQVLTRDLPLVASSVAPRLARAPQVALLKGWHNYACRHKLAGGYPADEPVALFDLGDVPGAEEHPEAQASALGRQVLAVRRWAEETETGDRDDLVPGVSDRAWRQVSVTAMECLGQRCPMVDECFAEAARTRAHEADVVVTNHAMLGIAASGSPGVLPEHQVLVVDEAHELADRVTTQATVELSAGVVLHAAGLARRFGKADTEALEGAGRALAATLSELPDGRFVDGLPGSLVTAVQTVRDATRSLLTALRPAAGAQPDGGLAMASSTATVLLEVAERMAAESDRDVLWCTRDEDRPGGAGGPRLLAAPLDVAGLVRTNLVAGRSTVLTSATLTLGGSFTPLALAVGLSPSDEVRAGEDTPGPPVTGPEGTPAQDAPAQDAPAQDAPAQDAPARQPWRGIDVGSPFDHPRSGILYVARHLPPPGREPATPSQLDEIAALVEAAGGATLGLFSSRRAAAAAAEAMRERLDVPVLCQGDDQLPTLVAQFAADEPTCLFGTLSLWQGVDVPGRACRLVLIDRIPFPRPDDPVRAARTEAVQAAGGNGFMAVSATHAALMLAQGAGRLLRTMDDRGVVAVLDPRLVTARYGTFLVRSLPPFWRTTDRDTVLAALERLAVAGAGLPPGEELRRGSDRGGG